MKWKAKALSNQSREKEVEHVERTEEFEEEKVAEEEEDDYLIRFVYFCHDDFNKMIWNWDREEEINDEVKETVIPILMLRSKSKQWVVRIKHRRLRLSYARTGSNSAPSFNSALKSRTKDSEESIEDFQHYIITQARWILRYKAQIAN